MTVSTPQSAKASKNRFGSTVPSQADLALLAQPLTLPFSGKIIKNRFCKAALSESLGGAQGQFDKDHLDRFVPLYDAWAAGGSGLVLTGNVMVDRTMREMEHNVAVEDSRDLGRLKVWAQTVQKHGAAIYAQISHPGRQTHAHLTENPVAPSAIPVSNFHPLMSFNPPRALTTEEIKSIITRFRTHDQYGGSLENRARFLTEIVEGIKAVTPKEFSIGVKLNSVDFGRRRQGGAAGASAEEEVDEHLEEAVQIAVMLEELGVDFIEISGGSYESFATGLLDGKGVPDESPNTDNKKTKKAPSNSTQKREAHFAVFAERISRALKTTKVILTGGFVTASAMTDSLKPSLTSSGTHIDMVGLGRTICQEPDLPNLILSGAVTGAVRLPKTPGGFFDDVFICGGNIRRMAYGKYPVASLGRLAVSCDHYAYSMDYAKVAVHKVKTIFS
ncbi:hypothetical protein BG015_000014 [Linnemannia schmuckeri]|uniref:NADH:flavin oxidoreductase/NADH oxidase N-terminal domain-containing protein n=1 Tax=Linnemannia schmuckeri TaxID=64567 RepID=A0A9P5VFT3_9FUNG|nr:hypothetical protein BG015_000014 [Linnemannia schmuckeri]